MMKRIPALSAKSPRNILRNEHARIKKCQITEDPDAKVPVI
jgi:hypothetical protein